ncbi:MAG: LPS assembly lipoprotein LptE [Crocinitomicaceae bacterium]|nr:LPS assembly lipoprotein LptE [Crocinitomicaceae bacterium]
MLIIALFLQWTLAGCWPTSVSFNDTGSLNPCLTHFEMDALDVVAPNAPINYPIELTEAIKSGIQNNTKLMLSSEGKKPQVFISGKITNYSVSPIALQEGDNAAKNRLTVSVQLKITFDCPKEDYSHEMSAVSTRFADFDANQDVSSVESQLLSEINSQIVQDVINQLLSNW